MSVDLSAHISEDVEFCDLTEGCGEPIRGELVIDADEIRGDRLLCLDCACRLGLEIF